MLALGLAFTGLGIAALFGRAGFAESLVNERGLGAEARWLWWMLAVCGGICLLAGMWARTRRVLTASAISLAALWIGYGLVAHPVLDASSSARNLMQQAFVQAGPGTEIGMVAWKEQNLLQARGRVTEFGFRQPDAVQLARGMAWMRQSPQTRLLLVHENKELACIAYGGPGTLALDRANRRSWWLVNVDAVTGCPDSAPAE